MRLGGFVVEEESESYRVLFVSEQASRVWGA